MPEIEEIRDRISLRDWLIDWPRENGLDEDAARAVAVTIAYRAAMRVLPMWWDWTLTDSARKLELTALPVLRCNLISGISALVPTPEIKRARARASSAVETSVATASGTVSPSYAAEASTSTSASVTASAASATASAARASARASAKASDAAFWEEIRTDCERIAGKQNVYATALWGNQRKPFEDYWAKIKDNATAPEWAFWIKWYDDALAGTPPNWKMLEQIALIESEVWEEGAEAVAAKIAQLSGRREVDRIIEKTPYAMNVQFDVTVGKLVGLPTSEPNLEQIDKAVRKALRDFKRRCKGDASGNKQGETMLAAFAPVLDDLKKDISKHKKFPLEYFDSLKDAQREVIQIADTEQYARESAVDRLISNLIRSGEDICVAAPDVLKTERNRAGVRLQLYSTEQIERAVKLATGMESDSAGLLKSVTNLAVSRISDPTASEEEKKNAWYFVTAVVPRGTRAVYETQELTNGKSGKGTFDKFVSGADKLSKLDKGVDAIQEANVEFGDWATEAFSQIASGNWFGLGGG
jgi:hypothetical protein